MKEENQKKLINARRNQILEAAARVFAEKGFHLTTTKDIGREAGIAEGTIYNYFESKTAILIGLFDVLTEQARQNMDFSKISPGDLREFLRLFLTQPLMAPKTNNFELIRIIISEIMVNRELKSLYFEKIVEPLLATGEAIFQQWADQGQIKPVTPQLLIRTVSSLILGLIVENIMGDQKLDEQWEELPGFLADLILNGIEIKGTNHE